MTNCLCNDNNKELIIATWDRLLFSSSILIVVIGRDIYLVGQNSQDEWYLFRKRNVTMFAKKAILLLLYIREYVCNLYVLGVLKINVKCSKIKRVFLNFYNLEKLFLYPF